MSASHPSAGELPRGADRDAARELAPGAHVVVVDPTWGEEIDGAQEVVRGGAERVLRVHGEPLAARRLARAHVRLAVDAHQAGGARAGEAKRPARPVVLGAASEEGAASGEQRRGDALAAAGGDAPAVDQDAAVGHEARIA